MSRAYRFMLCAGILAVDLILFAVPLSAVFLCYVILVNPPWFRDFLHRLEAAPPDG